MKEDKVLYISGAVVWCMGVTLFVIGMMQGNWKASISGVFVMVLSLPFSVGALKVRLDRIEEALREARVVRGNVFREEGDLSEA